MIFKVSFILSCLALGGCASSPTSMATCTDLISTGGGMLKFCQTGNRIETTESGIDPAADPAQVKVVNNLEALHGLQKQLSLRPEFVASRKLVARACVAKGVDYISISVSDLRRIIADHAVAPQASAVDGEPGSAPPQPGAPG